MLDELARLRTEHDRLSEQVKRLVKTESELYVIQEQLDGQIRIYRRLYEIGKELNATFELAKVLEVTAHFALYELNFERCLVLLRPIESTTFSVEMADGYYDESSIRSVESLVLPIEAPALAPLLAGAEELLCPQSSNQEHLLRLGQALGMQEYVVFPLGSDGAYPVGLLAAGNTEERAPYQSRVQAETDEMLGLANLASQATTAINKAKFYEALTAERQLLEAKVEDRTRELARSVEELRALGEVGQAVSSTLDLDRVLATVAARAVELSGTDSGVIYEYDPSTESFRVRATHRVDPALNSALQGEPLRIGEGAIGRAALDRRPLQIPDLQVDASYRSRLRESLHAAGLRSLLAIPLLLEGGFVGGLTVARREPGEFPESIVGLLQTFAAQSALAIQNARLYREVEEKSLQLELASKHKSEFLANMSHELRTPLNAIIGFSEVLLERLFGDVNDRQAEYLADILTSGQHLLSLINDILDLSKVEAGRMELEVSEFSLREALENGLTMLKERAGHHGIALGLEVEAGLELIEADERKVKQVVFNLLSNAVKFTPDGGRVDVTARRTDGGVEVAVRDTGVGIAPEDLPHVFDEFRQVGDGAAKAEGTGLGLALTKKLVELHGGTIWAESVVGAGSTFAFALPIRSPDRQPAQGGC